MRKYLAERRASLGHAIRGISALCVSGPNARIIIVATLVAVACSAARRIELWKWAAVASAVAAVWITEALNTALEVLCNYACGGKRDPLIALCKDLAAGATLLAVIYALVVGFIVFVPPIAAFVRSG